MGQHNSKESIGLINGFKVLVQKMMLFNYIRLMRNLIRNLYKLVFENMGSLNLENPNINDYFLLKNINKVSQFMGLSILTDNLDLEEFD